MEIPNGLRTIGYCLDSASRNPNKGFDLRLVVRKRKEFRLQKEIASHELLSGKHYRI
jgi:hypothetical protein